MEDVNITIKKSEFDRLRLENETLKRELENTKQPTEFLGKKASEWLALRDLINDLLRYSGTMNTFDDLTIEAIKEKIKIIVNDTFKLKEFDKCLSYIDIRLQNLKNKLNENML